MKTPAAPAGLPTISPWILRGFLGYARRYVAKHFHALRIATLEGAGGENGRPLIVYLNHASWWDPLIAMLLGNACFPTRPSYAPMDAEQLVRYGIFRKVGVFGVEQGTTRGARDFLRIAGGLLKDANAILWLTPQGRFADPRERPLQFAAGLGSLARRFPEAAFVPLALEYLPWGERLPEALARFGAAETGAQLLAQPSSSREITARLEASLARTMDALAADAILRDPARFSVLHSGSAGVSPVYDFWRKTRARLRGETFQAEHRSSSAR